MSAHPDFVIVCDHGIGGGQLDQVARFEWADEHGGWYLPLQFTAAALRPLTGDQHTQPHLGDEPTRNHYEIPCQTQGCWRRAYRSDEARLRLLFATITADQRFRDAFAVSVTDAEITITLDALHYARDTAKKHGVRA